jgi:hypothetical protein
MLQQVHIGSKGGFQTFAAVANQPPGKDGSGHSERVKIEDFSAVPHGGSEPKPEVLRNLCSQMRRRNRPKPSAASQQEKRPFVMGAANS